MFLFVDSNADHEYQTYFNQIGLYLKLVSVPVSEKETLSFIILIVQLTDSRFIGRPMSLTNLKNFEDHRKVAICCLIFTRQLL